MRRLLVRVSITLLTIIFLFALSSPVQSLEAQLNKKSPEKNPKETIVFVHGMFVGPWCWDNFKKYFEDKGYQCIVPTLRYHDTPLNSPPNPNLGTTSILDYVNDLEKEIRKLDAPPIIIGHSMGGLITQILVSRGLAKSAVLISPAAPRWINAATWTTLKSAWRHREHIGLWYEPLTPSFEGAAYSSLHLLPDEEQKRVFSRFTYESGRALWEIVFWPFDFNKATWVDVKKVTCPILTIVGKEDRTTTVFVVKQVHDKYERVSTYMEFDNQSHWIIGEPGWKRAAESIYEWLNKHLRAAEDGRKT